MRRSLLTALLAGVLAAGTGPSGAAAPLPVAAQPSTARSFTPAWLGLNGNTTQRGPAWDDAAFGDVLARFRPGTLRYPGGTIGNYWDWRAGWFQPGGPWPGQTDLQGEVLEPFDNGVEAFAAAVRASGARPTFVLNLLTVDGRRATVADDARQRADQVAFLRAAAAQGLRVDRVELGNEFYLPGMEDGASSRDYVERYPDGAAYADQVRSWLPALREAFPRARIAAVGAESSASAPSPRRRTWNDQVLAGAPGVDALTLHLYVIARDETAPPEQLLDRAQALVRSVRRNEVAHAAAAGKRTWVTEFNTPDRTPSLAFGGSWVQGLSNAVLALGLLEDPSVELAQLHNVVGDAVAGAFWQDVDGFRGPEPATVPLARTATGTTLAAVERAAAGATRVQPLTFPGGPALPGGAPGLVGSSFTGPAGRSAVVVNASAQPVVLDVRSLYAGGLRWERLTAPTLTTRVTGPGVVAVRRGEAVGSVLLPARAVLRLQP